MQLLILVQTAEYSVHLHLIYRYHLSLSLTSTVNPPAPSVPVRSYIVYGYQNM